MGRGSFEVTKEFLKGQGLAPLLQRSSQQLQTLNKWSTAGQALQVLGSANVLSAPVLDEDQEYYGCLSVNDLLKDLIHLLHAKHPDYYEKISSLSKEDLLAIGEEFCKHTVDKLQHAGDLWLLNADDQSSLLDAVLESFRIQDATVHHRLYVCCNAHEQKSNTVSKTTVVNITPGSERLNATGLKVTHVVSQSDVIKMLWGNKPTMSDVLSCTVEELEMDAGAVFTVPAGATALEAFSMMARDHKSALGITDPASGKLIGNISASDIRGLKAEEFDQLLLPVADYVLVRHGKAPAGAAGCAAALAESFPVVTVSGSTTFEAVLELLSTKGLHRVYVADAEGKPISVITLTDVLRKVTKAPVEPPPQRVVAMEEDDEDDDDEDDDEEEAAA